MERYALVSTSWGLFTIVANGNELLGTFLPCLSEQDCLSFVENEYPDALRDDDVMPELQESVRAYFYGTKSTFRARLALDSVTPFQRSTIQACRRIAYGKTCTYGELASRAEHPHAARAVGTVMSNNRFPLIVPCHRVVSSAGLGGFSSSGGVSQKLAMLELEGWTGSK